MRTLILSRFFLQLILVIMALLAFYPGIGQIKVTHVEDPGQLNGRNGIVYTLPRTLVICDLIVSKDQQFAGPLAAYAAEFMGIDEVIGKDAISYSIESAMIRTLSEPDPDHVYLVENEDKSPGEVWISFGKQPSVMTLESFDKTMSPDGFSSWNKDLYFASDPGQLFRKYTDSPTREVTDTITRRVSIDTLVIEEQIFRHSREEYSDREKAQDAADRIRQIEHDKYNLLIGYPETPYSKDALAFMISELEKQRQEYLKLFTGVTVRETLKFSYPVLPEAGVADQEYKLAAFTKGAGMVAAEGQNEISLVLKVETEMKSNGDIAQEQAGMGIVYQVPQTVQATLNYQGIELDSRRIEILQFGVKMSLPPTFKRIELDLENGSVRSVVFE